MHAGYMKFLKSFSFPLLAALMLAGCNGCNKPATAAGGVGANPGSGAAEIDPLRGHLLHAQPKLPTVKIWLGAEELIAEIASEPVQIATGMMFRTNMPENTAMIFIFSNAAPRNFYMRNCTVPLSAAYIAPDGAILEIIKLNPGDETGVQSQSHNVQFVLEVPQGWFDRHNVRTGALVRTERGSLAETFLRNK